MVKNFTDVTLGILGLTHARAVHAPDMRAALVPDANKALQVWSTSPLSDSEHKLPLSDSTLRPVRVADLAHPYKPAPDGQPSMEIFFPRGAWGYNKGIDGGMSWYGQGQTSTSDWNNAKEMTFGYGIYFTDDFAFNKGGKLPGLYFGTSEENARDCSGGNRDTDCASVRLMWRTDGKGEAYTYLPNSEVSSKFKANDVQCTVAPESDCNDQYGASVGRGAFNFKAGAWNDVAMRVQLNDGSEANGEIEIYFNGESKIKVDGLIISSTDATRAQGIMAQSFFGGTFLSLCSSYKKSVILIFCL